MYNYQRSYRRTPVRQKRSRKPLLILLIPSIIAIYCGWALLRPLPSLQAIGSRQTLSFNAPAGKLLWPANTQSAVGVVDTDIMQTNGRQTARPTASTAKILTALVVLEKYPLSLGQRGPTMTIGANDVAIYNRYVAQGGSTTPVSIGDELTLYQMLHSLMLPSSNNVADSMAIWAYGSLEAYQQAATKYLRTHGLADTKAGSDASGLSPDTVSTARDLVKLGELAMQDDVLSAIVGQQTADNIPSAGTIRNVNFLLGTNNIVGVKTGNSDEAGGVFVSASRIIINGRPTVIVTAVMGTPTRVQALQSTVPLARSAQANFTNVTPLKKGAVIGQYTQPWGDVLLARLSQDVTYTAWNGSTTKATVADTRLPANTAAGTKTGEVIVGQTPFNPRVHVPIVLEKSPTPPSTAWRLLHPL